MPTSPKSGLVSVTLKLARAQEHLEAITVLDKMVESVECKVSFTTDHDKGIGYFVIGLPEPPLELSTVVGDCLHNLRSTLDYLICQMVLSNSSEKPCRQNMFPICSTPKNFSDQVKMGRLSGVPASAAAIIERFQPYDDADHPLALLDKLYNADKHRDLNFAISVASDLDISYSRNGEVYLRTILGNDEVRNGAILGNVGIRLDKLKSQPEVQIHSQAACFMAFKDLVSEWGDSIGVAETLGEIRDYIANRVVPSLETFSLVGPDFYHITQESLFNEDERERINVFDWREAFPEVFESGGFDCVVGNPPYVKLQNFRKVQGSAAEYLVKTVRHDGSPLYASAQSGNFDLYLLFIEKGVELLKPEGCMGYIAPNVWMMNEYGQGLRAFTKGNGSLDRWVDFKSFQVFNEAITYTSLQFFRGTASDAVRCAFAPDGDIAAIDWQTPQAVIPYSELSDSEAWNLMPQAERLLIERLKESCTRLDDKRWTRQIFQGLITSADSIYHLTRLGAELYRTKTGEEVALEDAIMRPLVSGMEAKRYQSPKTDTWLLFPYLVAGFDSAQPTSDSDQSQALSLSRVEGKPRLYTTDEMQARFPLAFAYLKYHEQELRMRERGKFNDDLWYRFGRNQSIDKQDFPKLMVAQTVPNLRVVFDVKGKFYCNNVRVNGILPLSAEDGWYLLGILNATPADFIFRRIAKPKDGGYFEANKQFIAPLPIPTASEKDRAEVARLAKELQRLHTLRRELIASCDKRLNSDQTTTDKRKDSWLCADAAKRAERLIIWDMLLQPGARLSVVHGDDELRVRIDDTMALELFDLPETPFIAAQWRHAFRGVNVTESFDAKRLVKLLLNLRSTDHDDLKQRLVELDSEVLRTDVLITTAETEMNELVYSLYGLEKLEKAMVAAG